MTETKPNAETPLEILRRVAKVQFSRDRGEPDPTPAFPTHVEIPIQDWYKLMDEFLKTPKPEKPKI